MRLLNATVTLTLVTVLASPCAATTYVLMADADLLQEADLVIEGDVLRVLNVPGAYATDTVVLARRVLRGTAPASTLLVRQPGGEGPSGLTLRTFGTPRMREGQEAIIFLKAQPDGVFGILHLALGVFYRVEGAEQPLAMRDLDEATVLDLNLEPKADLARDYHRFTQWLADMDAGKVRPPDYFRPEAPDPYRANYELLRYRGNPLRWFDFDARRSVSWRFRSAGGGQGRASQFRTALNAWNAEASTPISYALTGGTASRSGFRRPDRINAIIFGDPNREVSGSYNCQRGGVLAAGGSWFETRTTAYRGRRFHRILEADIVVNDGVDCFMRTTRRGTERLFAHELGHTLGLGHSRSSGALMWAFLNTPESGARLSSDDVAGIRFLYQGSGSPGPGPAPGTLAAPSNLAASATSRTTGTLSWKDNSTAETRFQIVVRVPGGRWAKLGDAPRNTESTDFTGATPGATYDFKVRARGGPGEASAWSNVATVKMPGTGGGGGGGGGDNGLAAPSNLAASATSRTTGTLSWKDNSTAETRFQVVVRVPGGRWAKLGDAPRNTESTDFTGATPGATYDFKVRARGGSGEASAWSNVARVTMPR